MIRILIFVTFPLLAFSRYHRFQYGPRNIQCHCVPPHLCNDNEVALDGHGLLDPRISNQICSNPTEICCDNLQREPEMDEDEGEENLNKPVRCGVSTSPKSRITSDTVTNFGELPWSLIIQEKGDEKGRNIYKCGGALIHPKVALTAAHCVISYNEEPEKLLVRAGEWNVDSREEPLPFQDNSVSEIVIHKSYSPLSLKNDISLLILEDEFELAPNVGVICISSPSELILENECLASGWGKNAYKKGKYSTILKKVQVPIMNRSHCLKTLRSTRLGPRYVLHKSFICAGGKKNEDSCKGDGGSPLICPLLEEKERFVQVGIVSWGIGCGADGVPGIYVNVALYLEWIEEEMTDRDLDTSYFKI